MSLAYLVFCRKVSQGKFQFSLYIYLLQHDKPNLTFVFKQNIQFPMCVLILSFFMAMGFRLSFLFKLQTHKFHTCPVISDLSFNFIFLNVYIFILFGIFILFTYLLFNYLYSFIYIFIFILFLFVLYLFYIFYLFIYIFYIVLHIYIIIFIFIFTSMWLRVMVSLWTSRFYTCTVISNFIFPNVDIFDWW